MRIGALAGFLAFVGFSVPAKAQISPEVVVGQRVRVRTFALPNERFVGRVVQVRYDTLIVLIRDSLVSFNAASISRIEARRSKRKAPIIVGAAAGAVSGAVIGSSLAGTECLRGPAFDPCDSTTELGAPLAGAVVGAFVGGALGSLLQGSRWQEVVFKSNSTTVGRPEGFGLAIGVRVRVVLR